jgi:hypothetical protein
MEEAREAMRAAGMDATHLMMDLFDVSVYVEEIRENIYPFRVEEFRDPQRSRRQRIRRARARGFGVEEVGGLGTDQVEAYIGNMEDTQAVMNHRLRTYREDRRYIPNNPVGRAVRKLLIASQNEEKQRLVQAMNEWEEELRRMRS